MQQRELDLTCYLQDLQDSEKAPHTVPFTRALVADERIMARAQHVIYRCNVKLFNQTEMATGLRDLRVVFVDDSGSPLITNAPHIFCQRGSTEPDALNLPARQWVSAEYEGHMLPEKFEALAQSSRVELRAYLPGDRPFVRELRRLWD